MRGLVARLQRSRAWHAWQRYSDARGNVLAGGIAYFAFFSTFPLLALGFTALGLVLGRRPELQAELVAYISDVLPGVLGPGGVVEDPAALVQDDVLSVTGAVAVLGLLVTGLGWVDATRQGLRAVFGQPAAAGPLLLVKARDVVLLATLGLAVLVSVLTSVVVNAAAGWLLDLVGLGESAVGAVLLRVVAVLVVLAADVGIFLLLFRSLSGVRLPWRDLRAGAVVGAVGLAVLKLSAGLLLGITSDNQFLAAFAVVVGLLVWLSFVGRLFLLAGAWAATTAREHGSLGGTATPAGARPAPAGPAAPAAVPAAAAGPRDVLLPSFGPRAGDRTAVAAGAVLGAGVLVVARVLRGGLAAALDGLRHARDGA